MSGMIALHPPYKCSVMKTVLSPGAAGSTRIKIDVVALACGQRAGDQSGKTWSINADYIEACSCHLFCPCYFNTGPEGGMMCEFNNAVKIAEGHVGDVKVDGLKFWVSGDLGGDFSKGM